MAMQTVGREQIEMPGMPDRGAGGGRVMGGGVAPGTVVLYMGNVLGGRDTGSAAWSGARTAAGCSSTWGARASGISPITSCGPPRGLTRPRSGPPLNTPSKEPCDELPNASTDVNAPFDSTRARRSACRRASPSLGQGRGGRRGRLQRRRQDGGERRIREWTLSP